MSGLVANLGSVHLLIWAIVAGSGALLGVLLARRDVTMGNLTLVFGVLTWSIFIGLIPIVNNAVMPAGFGGMFSGQSFARLLVQASPQAVLQEPLAQQIEVVVSALIGAVIFSACGFALAVVLKEETHG